VRPLQARALKLAFEHRDLSVRSHTAWAMCSSMELLSSYRDAGDGPLGGLLRQLMQLLEVLPEEAVEPVLRDKELDERGEAAIAAMRGLSSILANCDNGVSDTMDAADAWLICAEAGMPRLLLRALRFPSMALCTCACDLLYGVQFNVLINENLAERFVPMRAIFCNDSVTEALLCVVSKGWRHQTAAAHQTDIYPALKALFLTLRLGQGYSPTATPRRSARSTGARSLRRRTRRRAPQRSSLCATQRATPW